ncbi:beta-carotene 15,15'-monooxygenase [Solibacillus sp. CAU 1738]|uniref:beta-carotene 15,15'-monooxygenase n=1 Tax=Solibacillus sp. CAU 1738 TaxID=3140363 RepID=UPI00326013AA
MTISKRKETLWLLLFTLILSSNFAIYNTTFGRSILPAETNGVVLGSLIDLIIVAPIVFIIAKKKYNIKWLIGLSAIGCILARFIIPQQLLEPYIAFTWIGIAVELCIVGFELILIFSFIRYMPKIIQAVRVSNAPLLFAFPQAVDTHVQKNPIIHVLCSELLMFYYGLFSWRKTAPKGFTLHTKTSYVAFQIMMIHAIVIETLGIHWWLHSKYPIVSLVLLVLNIYSVLFFIADIQAVRLNPAKIQNGTLFLSMGLMKRTEIQLDQIAEIIVDQNVLQQKLSKHTAQFIAKDFETPKPSMLLKMKTPITVFHPFGMEKQYSEVAILVDEPTAFIQAIS